MAFVPTTPTSGKIKQPDADQALNTFHILTANFSLVPGEPTKTKVMLKWSEGYMDGDNYIPVNHKKGFWDAEQDSDLVDALNSVTTGGTMYNEVKTALWDFLQTKGEIGEGSIS